MTIRYLSPQDVAERLGLARGTVGSYIAKGMLPEPDAIIGSGGNAPRGWLPETIDEWNANRPGRGNWRHETLRVTKGSR